MQFFAKTDLGKVRQINQDFFIAKNEKIGIFPNLFMVADGVGSNIKSGFASSYSCEFVLEQLKRSKDDNKKIEEMSRAMRLVNSDLYYRIMANTEYKGMGTTLVMSYIDNDKLFVGNIGDSRCYHIRSSIIQVTHDHSMAEELVREGEIKRNSKKYFEYKNQLTRAIGAAKSLKPDFFEVELMKGDYILMSSDGLTNMVSDEEIFDIVTNGITLEDKVNNLIKSANENGGKDNIAIILIYIDSIANKNDLYNDDGIDVSNLNNLEKSIRKDFINDELIIVDNTDVKNEEKISAKTEQEKLEYLKLKKEAEELSGIYDIETKELEKEVGNIENVENSETVENSTTVDEAIENKSENTTAVENTINEDSQDENKEPKQSVLEDLKTIPYDLSQIKVDINDVIDKETIYIDDRTLGRSRKRKNNQHDFEYLKTDEERKEGEEDEQS